METEAQPKVVNGTEYRAKTPDDLIQVLESLRVTKTRVRIVYGDPATGTAWQGRPECGTVGRSCGTMSDSGNIVHRVPLLIANSRSRGGLPIDDDCIIQVKESSGGRVIWDCKKEHSHG